MFFVYYCSLSEEHRRVSENRTGGASADRVVSPSPTTPPGVALYGMFRSAGPAAARRAKPRKGPTTRRRAANAVAAAERAPEPSARRAGVSPIPPQRPNSLSARPGSTPQSWRQSRAAVDEKSGKRTTPPTDRARDGCAALPSSEAALAGGCHQQHGPRVPATTRCRSGSHRQHDAGPVAEK